MSNTPQEVMPKKSTINNTYPHQGAFCINAVIRAVTNIAIVKRCLFNVLNNRELMFC